MEISKILRFLDHRDIPEAEGMRLATHTTHGQVMVKVKTLKSLPDLVPHLREVFAQAKMNHPLIFPILDVLVGTNGSEEFVVALVFERFDHSLKQAIDRRKENEEHFSEYDLFAFLTGTVSALCAAQDLVPAI
jgi:hypothetical protein